MQCFYFEPPCIVDVTLSVLKAVDSVDVIDWEIFAAIRPFVCLFHSLGG